MGWPITPDGLKDLLVRINQEWPEIAEISITENGAAYDDGPDSSGVVRDERRSEYLLNHIEAMSKAIQAGAPVGSYFAWSFLDNFEWAEGYAKRFGLVHVDFDTQERTLKQSAHSYATVIAQNSAAKVASS
jgi:beta-glucosidase